MPSGSRIRNGKAKPGYHCSQCGGMNVEDTAWVNMNTGKVSTSDGPTNQVWCPNCDDAEASACHVESDGWSRCILEHGDWCAKVRRPGLPYPGKEAADADS